MTVQEILALVSDLSVGLESPTALDQAVYLRYLNLVHGELYRKTASFNPYVSIESKTQELKAHDMVSFDRFPLFILNVALKEGLASSLQHKSYDVILKSDPLLEQTGTPLFWYTMNKKVGFYPVLTNKRSVVVSYIPDVPPLTLETVSEEIPYPAAYHQVLVDGTCYYLSQGEAGFKNREELALTQARWERGKNELYSYFSHLSSGPLSTYSVV